VECWCALMRANTALYRLFRMHRRTALVEGPGNRRAGEFAAGIAFPVVADFTALDEFG